MPDLKSVYHRLTAPLNLTQDDGICYWREKVLLTVILLGLVTGFLLWLPSSLNLIHDNHWKNALFNTGVLFLLLLVFLKKDLSYTPRACTAAAIAYAMGVNLTLSFGSFGIGLIWLFYFPVVVSMLMGLGAVIGAICLNILTLLGFGLIMHLELSGRIPGFRFGLWHLANGASVTRWLIISTSFILLNIQAVLMVNIILKELHRALDKLGRSERKYRHIFENIMDIYFETDLNGRFLTLSPSILPFSGYPAWETLQKGVRIYSFPSGQRDEFLNELLLNGYVLDHEIQIHDRDGRLRIGSINARMVLNREGKPERITGICRDMTETKQVQKKKKELEERLNRSQKMEALGMLAGGVAHDLNNVLSGIVTYPELLLMELPKGSTMAKSMELVHASGLRATEIVQDLLTLSRRGVTHREPVNLNQLVEQFLGTPECRKILSYHPDIEVTTELSAAVPTLQASLIHLQKTVMNLISNAAEAQPDGGHIQISTANHYLTHPIGGYDHVQPGQYVVLSVEDGGTGIDAEDIKRIFEPFFTKKVMGRSGTGLGMAVVWGTVEDHYGYIDVTSHPRQGTRFDIYFPVTEEEIPTPVDPDIDLEALKGDGQRILVVDDIKNQQEIATNALNRLGYQVHTLDSGEEAVEFLKKNAVDLVILDMIMEPGIDGLETYRRILKFNPRQKAMIASGFSRTEKVSQALSMGVSLYLKKPYTLAQIGRSVRQILNPDMPQKKVG